MIMHELPEETDRVGLFRKWIQEKETVLSFDRPTGAHLRNSYGFPRTANAYQ